MLLDEPFGALDAQVRKELRRWLRQLHEELKFTSVFVTHDQEEAMEVADRVVVMSQGNIEQADAPERVWREPSTRFVLEFMGEVNRLQGVIRGGQFHVGAHRWPLGYTPAYQGQWTCSCAHGKWTSAGGPAWIRRCRCRSRRPVRKGTTPN